MDEALLSSIRTCPYCGGRPESRGSPFMGGVLMCCCKKSHKLWHDVYKPSADGWIDSWNKWVKRYDKS